LNNNRKRGAYLTIIILANSDGFDPGPCTLKIARHVLGLPVLVRKSVVLSTAAQDRVVGKYLVNKQWPLVNCHGVTKRTPSLDFLEADWDRIVDVNLKGTFLCCQSVGRVMIQQGRGSIVNLASIGGLVGLPTSVAYCASKGGVVQLTRTLGVEWAPLGVRVNAIAPSSFNTPMVRRVLEAEPEYRERVVSKIPIGRIAEAEEIVGSVIYLASAASSMVTGTILSVDGGYTAQ